MLIRDSSSIAIDANRRLSLPTSGIMLDPPQSRIPVEIWELILLEVVSSQSMLVFATTCSASEYLTFKRTCGDGENSSHRYEYVKSLQSRRILRAVCRSWKNFFDRLDLCDRWSHLPTGREKGRPVQGDWEWRLDLRGSHFEGAWMSLLSEWRQMGADGRYNTQLTRMEILQIDPEFFTRLLKALCDVAPVLKSLRSLGLTITDERYTIMEKLSIHFPELTHLTLCLHRVEHRLRSNDPQLEEHGSSMFKKLEVLFLLPGKRAFQTSHWNLPSLRHVCFRPADAPRIQAYEFLKRHAQTIETIDLDNNDKLRIGMTRVDLKNAFPTDFWETFVNLKLLRCSMGRVQLDRVPEQHHPIECFVLTDSVEQAAQLCNVLRPWVEGHNVKVLKRIVLYGYFLTKGYHLCEKGELPQLIEQLRRNGTRLVNPAGKSWI
jgi:hypothetical protein